MEVYKSFAVQFVHDMHFRHHFFSGLLGYFQELCGVFRPRAFLFNFLHNAKFTPGEDNKGYVPVYPWGIIPGNRENTWGFSEISVGNGSGLNTGLLV